jgi:methylmalonyl-CoA mutase
MEKEKLFQEFGATSTEEWKEKIIKDLKGADYDKKLVWKTNNGFKMQPFYRKEDLTELNYLDTFPGDFPFIRGNEANAKGWKVNQVIEVNNIEDANKKALEIRLKGVDSLTFNFKKGVNPTEADIEALLENIRIDLMEVNFITDNSANLIEIIEKLARKHNRNLEEVKGSVYCDPLSEISLAGKTNNNKEQAFDCLLKGYENAKYLSNFHCLTVDGSIFLNAAASTVSEMAFTLSEAVEYLNFLTDKGIDIDEASKHIRFKFASGSSYFMEIAKFRALRYLWAKIVNEFGISKSDSAKMHIHAVSSTLNKTVYDPYVNMLRTTTETMSAALGGVDSITVLPFDYVSDKSSELGQRIARNQQLLLKGESHFDKVNDPAAGSYYVENLTNELIENTWKLFLEVEEKGGYLAAFESGFITETINTEANKFSSDIAARKKIILGTNQYANTLEHITDVAENDLKPANKLAINPIRGAMEFENMRFATERFTEKSATPKVWMFTYGNLTMRKARAQFASNFFGCAGFQTIDNLGFATIEEGIAAAKTANPEIVVICSSDDEYKEIALPVFEALKNDAIIVLAGYPKDMIEELKAKGFTNFVHVKTNALAELGRYQKELGIV